LNEHLEDIARAFDSQLRSYMGDDMML
jgi:hypothetical protein